VVNVPINNDCRATTPKVAWIVCDIDMVTIKFNEVRINEVGIRY